MILSAGPTVEALTPFTGNREELKRALAGLEAYGTRPKFAEAIAFALASFDYAGVGANDAKELIALSDRPDQVVWPDAPGVERRAVAVGATAANLAITAFAVRQTMNLSSAYDALVEVANFGPSPARSELLVFTPEHSLGSQALALAPGERFSKVIGLPFGANGKLTALLRNTTFADGSHDALPTDDAAFAFLPPQRKARTLLVTAKNVFLYNALALDPEVELSAVKPGEYQPGLAAGADVAFFDGFAPPQPPPCNAVYFAPKGGPFTVKEVKQKPTATGWADGHPLLQHVTMDALTIESAEVFKPQPQDIALMGHYDGALMLLRQEGGRFLLGIGFDLAKTDFPLQAAFPILMHNIVHIFAGRSEGETPTGHQVGEKVDLALSAPRAQVTVQDPLDKKLAIPARAGRASMRPRIPGFYTYADGDALRVFAASLTDADESNLTGAPGEAMPAFPEIKENPTAEVWWPYFVLAALILAAADLALFFYGRLA
jgi:hypothetical protein